MPRIARIVVPDLPHHITQRGNRRQDVFFEDTDRRKFLSLLHEYAVRHGLAIHAYCLMTNHVHLIATPRTEQSLSRTLKPVHLRYTQHLNWTHGLSGRLWQGRFFSCPLDEEHFLTAVRYVERNPVRAGLVAKAEEYPWSSAAAHCGSRGDSLITDTQVLSEQIGDWSEWLRGEEDEQLVSALRHNTRTGRPLGSESFLDRFEQLLGRVVRRQKAGRPRKGGSAVGKYG